MTEEFQEAPIDLNIKNWPETLAKPRFARRTTVKTHILDASGATGPKYLQIASVEPDRLRLVVQPLMAPIALCLELPVTSPDGIVASIPPTGRYLPASLTYDFVFYGQDAWWINSLGAGVTMVTVTKEYC